MFVGSIESEFRRWFDLNKAVFTGRPLYVGCSGNFTVEQLIGRHCSAVHGNDVSIYTHFLGHHLAGQTHRWRIQSKEWEWLQPYFEQHPAAAMVLLYELLKWPPKNSFNKRMHDAILGNWEGEFAGTVSRVESAKQIASLTTYRSSDIWDFADEAKRLDPAGIFVAFLPFYKGGYERLYKKLDEIFEWETPTYQMIDRERKAALIEKIKGFDYVFIDDVEYPNERAVMLKRKTATKQMWLYSNLAGLTQVLVRSHVKVEPSYYTLFTDADLATVTPQSSVVIKKVKAAQINYFRNRYLAKSIDFSDGMWNFLVFLDGKLFGFVILTRPRTGLDTGHELYMQADFVVPVEKSGRLAKLLLLLLQSTHFREVCEELLTSRITVIKTTAFTDKPVSMKYRGVFTLTKRGADAAGKKFLNYETATGLHTESEGITKWLMKSKPSSTN